jgi:hypothetical protein
LAARCSLALHPSAARACAPLQLQLLIVRMLGSHSLVNKAVGNWARGAPAPAVQQRGWCRRPSRELVSTGAEAGWLTGRISILLMHITYPNGAGSSRGSPGAAAALTAASAARAPVWHAPPASLAATLHAPWLHHDVHSTPPCQHPQPLGKPGLTKSTMRATAAAATLWPITHATHLHTCCAVFPDSAGCSCGTTSHRGREC